jgi:hypothetical protein
MSHCPTTIKLSLFIGNVPFVFIFKYLKFEILRMGLLKSQLFFQFCNVTMLYIAKQILT